MTQSVEQQIEVRAVDLERLGISFAFVITDSPARIDALKKNAQRIADAFAAPKTAVPSARREPVAPEIRALAKKHGFPLLAGDYAFDLAQLAALVAEVRAAPSTAQ